jgi:hypothetical protein
MVLGIYVLIGLLMYVFDSHTLEDMIKEDPFLPENIARLIGISMYVILWPLFLYDFIKDTIFKNQLNMKKPLLPVSRIHADVQ